VVVFLSVALQLRLPEILLFKIPLSPLGCDFVLVRVAVDLLFGQYLLTLADIASMLHLSPVFSLRFGHLSRHSSSSSSGSSVSAI
jgi:hypothetical protein